MNDARVALQALHADIIRRWEARMRPELNTPTAGDLLEWMGHVNEAFADALSAAPPAPTSPDAHAAFVAHMIQCPQCHDVALAAVAAPAPAGDVTWQSVKDAHPEPHARYVVKRDGLIFTATPCYGMHAPWWVVRTMADHHPNEAAPEPMRDSDEWLPIEDVARALTAAPAPQVDGDGAGVSRSSVHDAERTSLSTSPGTPPALVALVLEVAESLEVAAGGDGVMQMFRVARFEADRLRRAATAWTPAAPSPADGGGR